MSSKNLNSFLLRPDSNTYSEPLDDGANDSSVVRDRPARPRSRFIDNPRKRAAAKFVSRQGRELMVSLNNSHKEPVICREIYALATWGRNEVSYELQGSTHEELRDSLRLALQKMPG